MAIAPTKATVAPAPAPTEAAPSVVVQNARELKFMDEPAPVKPHAPLRISARVAAEHAAGAEALDNYR